MAQVTEELLRHLIGSAEELRERHLDDVRNCKTLGSDDGALDCLKHARAECSLIRKARKALLALIKEEAEDAQRKPLLDRAEVGECPYCGSGDVQYEGLEHQFQQVEQKATCSDCEASWWEIYGLSNIVRHGCDCRQYQAKGECDHV